MPRSRPDAAPVAPGPQPQQVAAYIAPHLEELETLASRHGLRTLAYVTGMAKLEAAIQADPAQEHSSMRRA